ncbi:dicer-like protein 2 [Phaeosphaeriaceae sp. PMI808]|nr:dicer-like protein 2 [Phaeosphaeriaceae sp. PMI808]
MEVAGDETTATSLFHDGQVRLRSYQAEMVEESMTSNIICVMDTGSGKTHIAIDRARAELERCQPDKLVWFLAPTITLCEQQYEVFKRVLLSYSIQLLSKKNALDYWTDQSAWDAMLHGVHIVISTHQVLLDALTHAFINMSKLALLIFDEAHHCTLEHPAHQIMSNFFERSKGQRPWILGLSASPIKKTKATSENIRQIERNLRATIRTPKLNELEFMKHVHKPQISPVYYPAEVQKGASPKGFLATLQNSLSEYKLAQDPYVLKLIKQHQQGHDIKKDWEKVFFTEMTTCKEQLKLLADRAEAMSDELGASPMEIHILKCIKQLEQSIRMSGSQLFDESLEMKKHQLMILTQLSYIPAALNHTSRKVDLLVDVLVAEAKDNPDLACLVFIEQRIWVAALAEILTCHPRTKGLLRVGTFVGKSPAKRKADIATLAEPKNQQATLGNFRTGIFNVVLATSVLEEGVDVSSCDLVICFERPKNIKSFVQRRGRARKQGSKYLIFIPESGGGRSPEMWQSLEAEMKAAYSNSNHLERTETPEERMFQEDYGKLHFEEPVTGALLIQENAPQHLNRFCAQLRTGLCNETLPEYEIKEIRPGIFDARVILPISVDSRVRIATSSRSWESQRLAKQDAALQAYIALYDAGLVNKHLLPARQEGKNELSKLQIPDNTPALVPVSPTFDPWPSIAQCHQDNPHFFYRTLIVLRTIEEKPMHMLLLAPTSLPAIPETVLFWNQSKHIRISTLPLPGITVSKNEIKLLRSATYEILYSVAQGRMEHERMDFPWLLAPCDSLGDISSDIWTPEWGHGSCLATELTQPGRHDVSEWGLITQSSDGRRYIPKAITLNRPDPGSGETEYLLQVIPLPKRRDFLHPMVSGVGVNDANTRTEDLDARNCMVSMLHTSYSIFALLFPSVLYRIEVSMVAETLRTTLLSPVAFDPAQLPLIIRAVTSSATGEDENYQRLEFLGDCILKFISTVHLMANKLNWPESFLTAKKGSVVSNGFLARATLAAGLDKFVITKRFTGAKWAPRYVGDLLAKAKVIEKQKRSSKVIADVIESLIGASYVTGGFDTAFSCVATLLPLEPWTRVSNAATILHAAAPDDDGLTGMSILEALIGHTFRKKMLLLEALTHSSFRGATHNSYERLEFLGDAVLDYIVSKRLYAHKPPMSHQKMHAIRTATVNASFLAFRMLDQTTDQPELQNIALWQFMRSHSHAVDVLRDAALGRHASVRKQIADGLHGDARYPWQLFALTDPPKFLSDIVESVIGAVYVDSHGDIPTCEIFVRRLGILDCLDRILRDGVDCLHPKERLGHLAETRQVRYVPMNESDETYSGNVKLYRCRVKVGGVDVGGVVEGLKRLNAETIAACRAIRILESPADMIMEDFSEDDEFFEAEEWQVMLEDW